MTATIIQNTLLLIDIQKDFHNGGTLAITNADDDIERIVHFITKNNNHIHRIICTLDSHTKLHIAHPTFWIHSITKEYPKPFTIISYNDICNGIWIPNPNMTIYDHMIDLNIFNNNNNDGTTSNGVDNIETTTGRIDIKKYCMEYTRRLEEENQKFQLCIWPEHCLMGSIGHTLVDQLLNAIHQWTEVTGRNVEYIYKGQNIYTEMYSAFTAEVPISKDTTFNETLHHSIVSTTNKLYIAGQALSHCVNYTVRDIVQHWPKNNNSNKAKLSDIHILVDCTSPVSGFESVAEQFLSDMKEVGVQMIQSTEAIL